MTNLKAIIWDVDGTLADTEKEGHLQAFNSAFKQADLDWCWSDELYAELLKITGGKERIKHFIDNYVPDFRIADDIGEFIRTLHASKTTHYLQRLSTGSIPLRPGVARLLAETRNSGIRLAIATTTTYENVTHLLNANLGASSVEWFDVIAAGDVVKNKKPAPDIFEYALTSLQLSAADCLALEDSRNGFLSAQAAGLKVVVTVNGFTAGEDFSGASLVVTNLGEPDAPYEVLQGDASKSAMVNIRLLQELHSSA